MRATPKRLVLEALRSGDYDQATGVLHRSSIDMRDTVDQPLGFCCLGVMCEVAIKNGVAVPREEDIDVTYYGEEGADTALPAEVMRWLGIDHMNPRVTNSDGVTKHLSEWNDDDGLSFGEIADLIETLPTEPDEEVAP